MRIRVGPKVVGLARDGGKRFEYIGRVVRCPGYREVWLESGARVVLVCR